MDPTTAIGLVGNILTFIDFASKVLKRAKDIHDSSSGALEENQQREVIAREMQSFASQLLVTQTPELFGHDKGLCDLATECQTISRKLIELLDKVKAKRPNSTRHSFVSAVRNKWYERDSQDLEQRLSNCRDQLELQLNFILTQDNRARLDSLIKASEKDITRLKMLQETLDKVSHGVEVASLSPQAREQVRQLVCVPDEALTIIFQQRILKSLAFDGMHGRYEMVDEAHSKTVRWIFGTTDGDSDVDSINQASGAVTVAEDKTKRGASNKLRDWLSSGDGIFHISGKLGSGKSTLMKFLCDHPGTRTELQKWAAGRTLIFTNFFFWKPGTALQKSLAGLQRALLYENLHTCPDLIPQLLPETWNEVSASPWQAQWTVTIPERNIRMAFTKLITKTSWRSHYCFCFFIDGLDEFEETALCDHRSLIEFLCNWTETAPGDIKLCVSSREHNVFMNAFPTDRRIRIHELSYQDMILFCQDKLSRLAEDEEKENIIKAVVDKAQGIFLWVALVTRSMREQLENGATTAALNLELDLLPDELDGLYKHIIKSVGKSTRRKLYRTLRILGIAKHYKVNVSMLAYSYLEDYDQDSEFAMVDDFSHMSKVAVVEREALVEIRLKGLKGLLEPDSNRCLDYVHRSVADFTQSPWMIDAIDQTLCGFDGPDAVSQILLAEMQIWSIPLGIRLSLKKRKQEPMTSNLPGLLHMRADNNLDAPPYSFLTRLEAAQLPFPWECFKDGTGRYELLIPIARSASMAFLIAMPRIGCMGIPEHRSSLRLPIPCYILSCLGYDDYFVWKILNDARMTANPMKVMLAARMGMKSFTEKGWRRNFSILQTLLGGGFLYLHAEAPVWPDFGDRRLVSSDCSLSCWHVFIAEIVYLTSHHRATAETRERQHDHFGLVLELCLQYKPDLDFAFTINPVTTSVEGPKQHAGIKARRNGKCVELVFACSMTDVCVYPTLRSWIEQTPFKNKTRLLQMYDLQMVEQQQKTSLQSVSDLHLNGKHVHETMCQGSSGRSVYENLHTDDATEPLRDPATSATSESSQTPLSKGSPSLNAPTLHDCVSVFGLFVVLGALTAISIAMLWTWLGIGTSMTP